jgi:hypothetical protein
MSQNETLAALTINLPTLENPSAHKVVTAFFIPSQKAALQRAFCLQE